MHFTDLFIKRPVFACVLSLIIFLFGLLAYQKLSLRLFPKIEATTIHISTSYPGASAKLMASQISTPIENALSGVDGLNYITSSSTEGNSDIKIRFTLGYNIDAAVADVISKVSSVRRNLPQDTNDPIIRKSDPNAIPILYISFISSTMTAVQIHDYLQRVVQPVLATLPGVGQAQIFGSFSYAMRIWLNPFLMTARGITLDDVMTAMRNNNLQAPTGRIKNAWQEFNTSIRTDISTASQFNNLVVKLKDGQLLRLRDIGYAQLGTPELRSQAFINNQNTNVMAIVARSDANPLLVAQEVKQQLAEMTSQFPKGLKGQIAWDNSHFIANSIKEVKSTILEAVIFVLLVIFLFLGSLRTMLIPLVTIPLSLVGVCGVMYAMGYSLNTITFLAFVLAIGMVVDDAIVVSENIHRHIELGKSRLQAALIGAREIRFAVIAMTLTLAAVYTPIVFTSGLTGSLFKEFALTLAATIIISGFIALTLSPMMCSKILSEKGKETKLESWVSTASIASASLYKKILTWVLRFRPAVLVAILIIFSSCYLLYVSIPEELAPKEDMGALLTIITAPPTANFDYTKKYAKDVDKVLQSVPEKVMRLLVVGTGSVNSAIEFLTLKDWSQRSRSVDQVIASLLPKLKKVMGVEAFPVNPFGLPGSSGRRSIKFVIKSIGSYEQLSKVAQTIKQVAEKNPAITNLGVDLSFDKPQYDITINRNLAAILGVSMSSIGTTINMALGQPQFNRFIMRGRSYYVIPQIESQFRDTPQELNYLNVRTASGQLVPLSSFVKISEVITPQSLNHFQQMRAATISGSPAPGYTLGQALTVLEKVAGKYMHPDMQYDFAGQARQFIEAKGTMLTTFIFAIIFIFLILAAQFESFRDPLIVMFTVPLSTAGALTLLKLTGGTINIYTQIGLVTLVGLISKHGILMVEFANQLLKQGKSFQEAIVEAATIRLRPILMTTAAMILSAVPLAFASGAGANSRHQMGVVIIGGMALGTLFTLFVIPTVYTYLATKKESVAEV